MPTIWSLVNQSGLTCQIIHDHSQHVNSYLKNKVNLIVTSPPYADARKKHYESIVPDQYPEWFMQFHQAFWQVLRPHGSMIINIKDKIVQGVRHRYVWRTVDELNRLGWQSIDDYIWHKKNSMPGRWSTRLRDGWEYVFHLAKDVHPCFYQNQVKIPVAL
ncbi:MAG TPA: DNA methyltransferase, partial [Gammaproteobacteria bacterium]|nr:DNA methyltransferase [Gammaproteobacteria bacterium]